METLGALGDGAAACFKDLGARIITVPKERRSIDFLMQKVSVTIQRVNAAYILETLPTESVLDENYLE